VTCLPCSISMLVWLLKDAKQTFDEATVRRC